MFTVRLGFQGRSNILVPLPEADILDLKEQPITSCLSVRNFDTCGDTFNLVTEFSQDWHPYMAPFEGYVPYSHFTYNTLVTDLWHSRMPLRLTYFLLVCQCPSMECALLLFV